MAPALCADARPLMRAHLHIVDVFIAQRGVTGQHLAQDDHLLIWVPTPQGTHMAADWALALAKAPTPQACSWQHGGRRGRAQLVHEHSFLFSNPAENVCYCERLSTFMLKQQQPFEYGSWK